MSAAASADLGAPSRTSSNRKHSDAGAPFLDLPVSPNSRDSFISILDDPFFQRLHNTLTANDALDTLDDPPATAAAAAAAAAAVAVVVATSAAAAAAAAAAVSSSSAHHADLGLDRPELWGQKPVSSRAPPPSSSSASTASTASTAPTATAQGRHDSDDNELAQRRPPRRESLIPGSTDYEYTSQFIAVMESFEIAIIGADGAGKSTFIQRVLGQPHPPTSNASNVRYVVDSTPHMVTLLELDIDSFELNTVQPIQWPRQINGHIVPRVDAALILYDVKNLATLRLIPRLIACLTSSGLPAAMAACKCDQPEDDWAIDAESLANQKPFDQCQAHYRISADSPDSARACLQAVIRGAIAHRRKALGDPISRTRSQLFPRAQDPSGRPKSQGRHSRASSDHSSFLEIPTPQETKMPGSRTGLRGSFEDVDDSALDLSHHSEDVPLLQRSDDIMDQPSRIAGVPFDDLVDRLLAVRLTKADHSFAEIFLCLYRKFAAPRDLLSAILTRLDRVREDKTTPYIISIMTQLRFIETLATWVSLYPGDFARPSTRRSLDALITQLFPLAAFNFAARQMRKNLIHNVHEDDDTGWAHSDESDDCSSIDLLSRELGGLGDSITDLRLDDDSSLYGRPSMSVESVSRGSASGSQVRLSNFDDYEREAARLEPTGHVMMNKSRFSVFMEIPDDEIADEITRIEWILFSSIRTRDFVRHVSLSASAREGCKSLKNVDRMISHFNYVAKWVANMILFRDKAKHRAQILEKFINIAVKLRQMNNYNGLAAVLAGLNGSAIHRLSQTRALVPPEQQKKLARLGLLMGTQKSHFAYRLAWENSPLPRIPFMPLHRRDLLSAEQGSKTFVGANGDQINWSKFEILGEVLLPFMKSQGTPYPNLSSNDTARELILGYRMPLDEEEIYQRSLDVEAPTGGAQEPGKKMFPWFPHKQG